MLSHKIFVAALISTFSLLPIAKLDVALTLTKHSIDETLHVSKRTINTTVLLDANESLTINELDKSDLLVEIKALEENDEFILLHTKIYLKEADQMALISSPTIIAPNRPPG